MPTQVLVPPLGQTVDTLSFAAWLKHEGERVQQGEALYVVETDKATLDVESPATGILSQVTAAPGDQVKVLSPIAMILTDSEVSVQASLSHGSRVFVSPRARRLAEAESVPLDQLDATGPEGAVVERDVHAYLAERRAAEAQAARVAASAPLAAAQPPPAASPLARRLAEQNGLDLLQVPGSGPRGQITREDVAAALAGQASNEQATPEPQPTEAYSLSGIRAVIAERMSTSSRETAPVTLTAEADATEFVRLREKLTADGVPVSYNDLLLYSLSKALHAHPRLNASLDGDSIKVWPQIDVGLAVDTERGLLVPVLRSVDRLGLAEIAARTRALTERARAGQCSPDELRGGTFTLTNLGMFGIDAFTPIINLPECAILGVGRIKTEPAWIGDHVEPRQKVWLSLTFDHRLMDGGPAARFLQTVVKFVEKPHLLMA